MHIRMHTASTTSDHFLVIEFGPSHEGKEYADRFEDICMCKGNNNEEFLQLECRHNGVFKDTKGNCNF